MLERIVHGWRKIEAPFLTSLALETPVILLARHGTAKTWVMRVASTALGEKCRFYSAPKEDIVSIAGLPDPKRLAEGEFVFVPHKRTMWDADVLAIDELPRAPRTTQNLLLEPLQERTLFGYPLPWKIAIATMNPDTYAASLKLDAALGDRFAMVLPVPELQGEVGEEERKEFLSLGVELDNQVQEWAEKLEGLRELLGEIREGYASLMSGRFREQAITFTAKLLTLCFEGQTPFVSPRRQVMLVRHIIGLTAYYETLGDKEAHLKGATDALEYTLAVPLGIEWEALLQYLEALQSILKEAEMSPKGQYTYRLATMEDAEKLACIAGDVDAFINYLSPAEREKVIGQLLDARLDLLSLKDVIDQLPQNAQMERRVTTLLNVAYARGVQQLRAKVLTLTILDSDGERLARRWCRVLARLSRPPQTREMVKILLGLEINGREKLPDGILERLEAACDERH